MKIWNRHNQLIQTVQKIMANSKIYCRPVQTSRFQTLPDYTRIFWFFDLHLKNVSGIKKFLKFLNTYSCGITICCHISPRRRSRVVALENAMPVHWIANHCQKLVFAQRVGKHFWSYYKDARTISTNHGKFHSNSSQRHFWLFYHFFPYYPSWYFEQFWWHSKTHPIIPRC